MTQDTKKMHQPTTASASSEPPESQAERSEAVGVGGSDEATAGPTKNDPNPEVVAKPIRRKFTAKYKMRILEEADQCSAPGDVGRLLRQEGLYSSHLTNWRNARDAVALGALEPKKRGRKPLVSNPATKTIARLEKTNAVLTEKLRQATLIIEIQKKVAALMADNEETQ